jgi:ABC-type ATPase involved in cell division
MTPVLAFDRVSHPAGSAGEGALQDLSLRLLPGEALWLVTDLETPAVDLACGLRLPASGQAIFLGQDWAAAAPDAAAHRRARIGRVFWDTAWLSNLDLDENITLAFRHHRPGEAAALDAAWSAACARLGHTPAPGLRPAFASARELQRGQHLRALLGDPVLLLLERPFRAVSPADAHAFLAAVEEARARGAAVLWVGPPEALLETAPGGPPPRLDLRSAPAQETPG